MSGESAKVRYLIVHLPGPQWRAGVSFQDQPGVEQARGLFQDFRQG